MISIVIPTLNEEKIIRSTLAGIKNNLHLPCELVVSDGGSTDATVAIARKYATRIVTHAGPRQTIARGRNDGARAAHGDFLVFLDADCLIPDPDAFFTEALSQFKKDRNLVALTGNIRVMRERETLGDKIILGAMNFFVRMQNNVFHAGDAAGGEFQMVRRDAFQKIHGYREDLVTREDRDLFYRLSKVGRTFSDPTLTVFHTGRRAHQAGWPRLIALFLWNTLIFHIRGKVHSKEWKVVR